MGGWLEEHRMYEQLVMDIVLTAKIVFAEQSVTWLGLGRAFLWGSCGRTCYLGASGCFAAARY